MSSAGSVSLCVLQHQSCLTTESLKLVYQQYSVKINSVKRPCFTHSKQENHGCVSYIKGCKIRTVAHFHLQGRWCNDSEISQAIIETFLNSTVNKNWTKRDRKHPTEKSCSTGFSWERDYYNVTISLVWILNTFPLPVLSKCVSVERWLTTQECQEQVCAILFFFFLCSFVLVLWHRPRSSFDFEVNVFFF